MRRLSNIRQMSIFATLGMSKKPFRRGVKARFVGKIPRRCTRRLGGKVARNGIACRRLGSKSGIVLSHTLLR